MEPTLDHTTFLLTLIKEAGSLHPDLLQTAQTALEVINSDVDGKVRAVALSALARSLTKDRRPGYENLGILVVSAIPHLAPGMLPPEAEMGIKTHMRAAVTAFGTLVGEEGIEA
tara:strand:+ start:2210 stop:2551 length:342 start_codon:yes stop_codon:yes gene_type:complete